MAKHEPKRQKEPLGLSAVARQAGVSKQTVEYYILIGLLNPKRGNLSRRLFTLKDVRRIRLIRRLNQTGYTLAQIRETFLKNR